MNATNHSAPTKACRVLVLSPHPDDESIGCGGTLLRHTRKGDVVEAVFLTSGENGGHGRAPGETRRLREAEAARAAQILGLSQIEFWGGKDGALKATAQLVNRLRNKIEEFKPDRIYLPHDRETHCDHRATVRLVQRALTNGSNSPLPTVLMFEVWTPLQRMDEIVEITPYLEEKLSAIRAYVTQCAEVGFDDAVKGLNRYRGEMHSWPEGDYAEVFAELKL